MGTRTLYITIKRLNKWNADTPVAVNINGSFPTLALWRWCGCLVNVVGECKARLKIKIAYNTQYNWIIHYACSLTQKEAINNCECLKNYNSVTVYGNGTGPSIPNDFQFTHYLLTEKWNQQINKIKWKTNSHTRRPSSIIYDLIYNFNKNERLKIYH